MKGGRPAVDADVRHMTAGTHKFGAQFEAGRNANGFDGDVDAQATREFLRRTAMGSSWPLLTIRSARRAWPPPAWSRPGRWR